MIVVGLDLESTGLDKMKDRTIEVCSILWTTNFNRSIGSRTLLVQSDGVSIPSEVTELTGITQAMADRFGVTQDEAFEEMEYFISQAEAIVAFNGRRFDVPFSQQWAKRLNKAFPDKPLIDPFTDLPMRGQELITMCAKKGIYYAAHEAGADTAAMLQLVSKFPFDVVWARSQSPIVAVRSMQKRNENSKAKKHKFRWNPDLKI